MPGYAPASPAETPPAASSATAQQLLALYQIAAKYGFDPVLNGLGAPPAAESPATLLRHRLSHLRLAGTVLDERHSPRPSLPELNALDGVPIVVQTLGKHPPLERCILCRGSKGETYTICAGCYTTAARFAERTMLAVLPGLDEESLTGIQALTHYQFVRAIRRTPRLEPLRRAWLDPAAEAARLVAAEAVAEASRVTRLTALRAAANDPSTSPAERACRSAELRAAEQAQPWSAAAWHRGLAATSLDSAWLDVLARGDDGEPEPEEDDYPVEWTDQEWLTAPDRVAFLHEQAPPFIARPNTAAGGAEHVAALERNTLLDAWKAALARSRFDPDADAYAAWIGRKLDAHGGRPSLLRSRTPREWDGEECDRWDRWVDSILGGPQAAAPDTLDPFDAARCRLWGEAVATGEDGSHVPVQLPQLTSGLPSGRLRWPHFIREEIEAEFAPWGSWTEVAEDDGSTTQVWTDPEPATRLEIRRHLRLASAAGRIQRRLRDWARGGATKARRKTRPAVPRPKGSAGDWERAIRTERRNQRFATMARHEAGIHATYLERAETQND